MISSFVNKFGPYRRAGSLMMVALAAASFGCGSSDSGNAPPATTGKPLGELVSPDELYKWEGEGKAKHKVDLSRKERLELREKALQKGK